MKTFIILLLSLNASAAQYPWEDEPPSRWARDFSSSPRDSEIPLPTTDLGAEKIGTKTVVENLFERWKLSESVSAGRGTEFAEITRSCKGKIELDFALTAEEWRQPEKRKQYYRALDALMEKVGQQLLADFGNKLAGQEKADFLRALHALAWQETLWQHYVRYKNWFFVELSGGSYNKLDDWGISQVARSGANASQLLNESFFTSKGYCSIGSSLYYGYLEYYFSYLEARGLACNRESGMNKLVGAYNEYSSGFSLCHDGLSPNKDYRDYQIKAMGGFTNHFQNRTWLGQE